MDPVSSILGPDGPLVLVSLLFPSWPFPLPAGAALATLPAIESTEVQIDWTDALYGRATARIDALTAVGSMIEVKTENEYKTFPPWTEAAEIWRPC